MEVTSGIVNVANHTNYDWSSVDHRGELSEAIFLHQDISLVTALPINGVAPSDVYH